MTGDEKLLNPRLIEIEGKVMIGEAREVRLEECERPKGWKRIVVVFEDGSVESTGCMEEDAARRNYMVFTLYKRKWGKMINKNS